MFPEDQLIGEGMSSVNLHMQVVLNTLAVALVQHFEDDIIETLNQVSKAKVSDSLLLKTLLDDDEPARKKLKQRLPGRVRKWVGDYCLLACAPGDAMGHYAAALELTKQYSDHAWHGAALEGVSCALVAGARLSALITATNRGTPPQSADVRYGYSPDAAERCHDAINVYRKMAAVPGSAPACVLVLVIEASFKLARYYGNVAHPPQIPKALTLMRDTDPIYGPGCEMLRVQTQIQITLSTALLCESMGLKRKFAFYMQRAARLYRSSSCWPASYAFSMLAARVYGVKGIEEVAYDDNEEEEAVEAAAASAAVEEPAQEDGGQGEAAGTGDATTTQQGGGLVVTSPPAATGEQSEENNGRDDWRGIQQKLLEELVFLGYSMGEYQMVATYLVALLKLLAATEGRRRLRKASAKAVAVGVPQHGGSLVAQLAATQVPRQSLELQTSTSADGITDVPLSPRADDEPLTAEQQLKQQREHEQREYMKQQLQREQHQPTSFTQLPPMALPFEHSNSSDSGSGSGSMTMSAMRGRMDKMKTAGMDKMKEMKAAGLDKLGAANSNGTMAFDEEGGDGGGGGGGGGKGGKSGNTHSTLSLDAFLSGGSASAEPGEGEADEDDGHASPLPAVSMEGGVESQQVIAQYAAGLRVQHQVAMQLAAVTKGLPPNFRVDMSGLPTVVRVWPLAPPLPKIAVQKTGKGGAASGFYYNPYANQGRKLDGAQGGEEPMEWVAGELAQVRVLLHNPTALDLHVQRVQLVFENEKLPPPGADGAGDGVGGGAAAADGVDAAAAAAADGADGADGSAVVAGGAGGAGGAPGIDCYPSSVLLPPGAHRELILSAKPRAPGKLKIRAIKIVCFGLHWEHTVGSGGEGTSKPLPMSKTAAAAMAMAMGEERGPRQYMAAAMNAAAAAAKVDGGKETNQITVLPMMPLLQCSLQEWQPVPMVAVASAGAAGTTGGGKDAEGKEGNYAMLPLLRGERSVMHLCLECVGSAGVGEVEVSIQPVMRRSKSKGAKAVQTHDEEIWEEAEEKVGATELVFKGAMEEEQLATSAAEGEEKEGHSSVTGQSGVYYNDPVMRGRHGEMVEQEIVPDILRWDEASLRSFGGSLPLLSQCSFVLPVELLASPAYSGVNIVVGYSASPSSSHKRSLTMPLRLAFSPSLELLGLQVVAHPLLRTTIGTGGIAAGTTACMPQETDAPTCSVVLQISNPSRFPMVLNCEVNNEAAARDEAEGSPAADEGADCTHRSSLVIDPGAVRGVPLQWSRGVSAASPAAAGDAAKDWQTQAKERATQLLQQRVGVQWNSFAHGSTGELCPGMPQVRRTISALTALLSATISLTALLSATMSAA
jgi:hypothetical protein